LNQINIFYLLDSNLLLPVSFRTKSLDFLLKRQKRRIKKY